MRGCKKFEKQMMAFLSGELLEDNQEQFINHIEKCTQCRNELVQLRNLMNRADVLNEEVDEAMASINWDVLPAQIADFVFKKEPSLPRKASTGDIFKVLFQARFRPVYAGVLLGLLLGAVITFMVLRVPHIKEMRGREFFASEDFLDRVDLEMARRDTLDYLDKSQYLLLDFVQSPPERLSEYWQKDFASTQAKDLLSKKKYMNHQLEKFQMAKAKKICDQIEILFYELTQISEELSVEELEKIRNFIENRQILLKIKLVKRELEESEV